MKENDKKRNHTRHCVFIYLIRVCKLQKMQSRSILLTGKFPLHAHDPEFQNFWFDMKILLTKSYLHDMRHAPHRVPRNTLSAWLRNWLQAMKLRANFTSFLCFIQTNLLPEEHSIVIFSSYDNIMKSKYILVVTDQA